MTRHNSHSSRHTTLLLLAVVLIGGAFLALTAGAAGAQVDDTNQSELYIVDDRDDNGQGTYVVRYDADTGSGWETRVAAGGDLDNDRRSSAIAVSGDTVAYMNQSHTTFLNRQDGSITTTIDNPSGQGYPSPIGSIQPAPGGEFYLMQAGTIYRYESDGTQVWSQSPVPDAGIYTITPGPNGYVYTGVRDTDVGNAYIYQIEADGTVGWSNTLSSDRIPRTESVTPDGEALWVSEDDPGTATYAARYSTSDGTGIFNTQTSNLVDDIVATRVDSDGYVRADGERRNDSWGLEWDNSQTLGTPEERFTESEVWYLNGTEVQLVGPPGTVDESLTPPGSVELRGLAIQNDFEVSEAPNVTIESESFTGMRERLEGGAAADTVYGWYMFALNNSGGAGTVTATVSDDRGNSETHDVTLDAGGWDGVVDEFAYDASQCGTRPEITISVQDESTTFRMGEGPTAAFDRPLPCPANYTNVVIDRATLTSTPTGGLEYSARIIVPELSNHDELQTVNITDETGQFQTREVALSTSSADSATISGTLSYGSAQYGNDINVTLETIDDSATLSGRVWDPAMFPNDTFEFGIVEADAVDNDEIEHLHTINAATDNNDSVNVTIDVSDDAGHSTSFDEQLDAGALAQNTGSFFYLPEDFGDRINFTFSLPTQTVGTYERLDVADDTDDDEPPENASEADDGELHLRVTNHLEHGESSSYRVIYDDPALPGETRNVTGSASVTSDDTNLVTINSSAFRVEATDDENDSGVTTVRAYYDGRWSNRTVVVAQTDVENIDILPIWPSIEATIGDNTFFWILIATLGAAAAAQISTSFGGVGVFVIMMSFGWTIGDVGNGIMLTTIICGIFLGLNLTTNIDMQVRQ